jgi:hypothetical protein
VRLARAAAASALFGLGVLSLLYSTSLLMPATNPVSDAAPAFRRDAWTATASGVGLLALAAALARPSSSLSWRLAWAAAGFLILAPGALLLASVAAAWLGIEGAPSRSTATSFTLSFGAAHAVLGAACLLLAWARRRPRS